MLVLLTWGPERELRANLISVLTVEVDTRVKQLKLNHAHQNWSQ